MRLVNLKHWQIWGFYLCGAVGCCALPHIKELCDQVLPLNQFQSEAMELPHSACWLWLGWCSGLNVAPPRGVKQGWAGLGWFQPGCLDTPSGSSFVDTRDYRYLISLYLLIVSPGSSACCNPVSPAERRHFVQQIPQPVNLWLGSCGELQANNSWCSWTFH